jgi:probable phosphoglycerate mutase
LSDAFAPVEPRDRKGTRVLLLRHAESAWNAEGRWQGRADPALSPAGRAAALRAGTRLPSFRSIACSDLERARETARLIARSWTGACLAWVTPLLQERTVGPWEGLTREQIESRWPGYLADGRRPEGFESDDSVLRRLRDALAALERRFPGGRVLCVTHGGLVHALESWAGLPRTRLENLAGRWVTVQDSAVALGARQGPAA